MGKPKRSNLKPPGRCIFCGGGNLTKEHFWPKWAAVLLPTYPGNRHVEQVYTFVEKTKLVGPPSSQQRPGNAWTKKIRVVCRSCNSGWMSGIEEDARSALTPMIRGEAHALNREAMSVVTRWIVMKMMVGEQNQPSEMVTTNEQRRSFWQHSEMPKNLRIRVAKCGEGEWKTGYFRNAATMTRPTQILPRTRNVHSVTFGIGALLIHILHSTVDDMLLYELNESADSTMLLWPPGKSLTHMAASTIAVALNRAMAQPSVIWKPLPPERPRQ
jgi:hypothetical protein